MFDKRSQSSKLLSSTQNQQSIMDLLRDYLNTNPKTGYLIFQVYQESPLKGVLPVADAKITVSKPLGNSYFISKVIMTGVDGKTDPIPLPTVQAELSKVPGNDTVCSEYVARVEAPNFTTEDVYNIRIFDGITSIEPIKLLSAAVTTLNTSTNESPNTYKNHGKGNGNN